MNRRELMTKTETMIEEINGVLAALGDDPLEIPEVRPGMPEIELLRRAREEYTRRLLIKEPRYRSLPPGLIPDLFLQALRNREGELNV